MTSDTLDETGRRPAHDRGRKRDDDRTAAILEAAGELLMEQGVDAFTVQDVAKRAGSGTGAIYRRWSTKEALIAEAIRAMPEADLPETDDAYEDLRSAIQLKLCAALDQPDLLPGMIAAMRCDEGIASAVDDVYTMDPLRATIARLVGDDHALLDVLTELAPALALYRATFGRNRDSDSALEDDVLAIVDLIVDR